MITPGSAMGSSHGPNRTFAKISVVFLLYPPAFSILFGLIGLPIPSYLFGMVTALVILLSTTRFTFFIYPSCNKKNGTAALLFLLIFSSSIYTASTHVWLDKTIFIVYTIIAPVLLIYTAFFVKPRSTDTLHYLEFILYRNAIVLLWLSSICLFFFSTADEGGRLTLPGIENSIWVARYFGALVVVIFCSSRRGNWSRPLLLVTLALGLVDMLIAGSRTPLLALLFVFILYQYRKAGKIAAIFSMVAIATLLVMAYFVIDSYIFETGFYSLYDRFEILSVFEGFTSFPLMGYGVGSFGIVTTGQDFIFYPHNLFAEVFFEQGFVGLVLLISLLIISFARFRFNIIGYLLIYSFIGSLSSGDIPGNSLFYILIFLCSLPLGIETSVTRNSVSPENQNRSKLIS